jgi:hypothetical protein
MNNPIFTRNATPSNGQGQSLDSLRNYLGRLENIARRGRLSTDPREVRATALVFAEPSAALRRLAARDRRCSA